MRRQYLCQKKQPSELCFLAAVVGLAAIGSRKWFLVENLLPSMCSRLDEAEDEEAGFLLDEETKTFLQNS